VPLEFGLSDGRLGTCISAIEITNGHFSRKINCGGEAYKDYEEDTELTKTFNVGPQGTAYEQRGLTGSLLSDSSLAENLQIAPNTVKKYIGILESLYIVFLVRPYHRQIARSLLREPKVYLYDSGYVKNDEGRRFENSCAQALLKHVQFLRDVNGREVELHYLRTKDKRGVDFAVAEDGRLTLLLEAKLSDDSPSPHLTYFKEAIPEARAVQIVGRLRRESRDKGIEISRAAEWLSRLEA